MTQGRSTDDRSNFFGMGDEPPRVFGRGGATTGHGSSHAQRASGRQDEQNGGWFGQSENGGGISSLFGGDKASRETSGIGGFGGSQSYDQHAFGQQDRSYGGQRGGFDATGYGQNAYGQSGYGQADFARESGQGGRIAPLLGAAAAGFVAGLAANMGRKAVIEATTAVQGDWFDALKAEHRIVEQLFQQILQTDDSQTMKRSGLLVKLAVALSKHDLEETAIIYPALRMHGRDGEGRHLAADHADIKAYLFELDETPKDDPSWIGRVRAFQELVLEHVREEEEQIYPALRNMLTKEQNAKLTLKLHREGFRLA